MAVCLKDLPFFCWCLGFFPHSDIRWKLYEKKRKRQLMFEGLPGQVNSPSQVTHRHRQFIITIWPDTHVWTVGGSLKKLVWAGGNCINSWKGPCWDLIQKPSCCEAAVLTPKPQIYSLCFTICTMFLWGGVQFFCSPIKVTENVIKNSLRKVPTSCSLHHHHCGSDGLLQRRSSINGRRLEPLELFIGGEGP